MQKIEVFWRDIPAQVLVKRGRERGKTILSHRFKRRLIALRCAPVRPALDAAVDDALLDFMARRKGSFADRDY